MGVMHPTRLKQNLRVFWKLVNLQDCVWENHYQIIMKTILQEKVGIHYSTTTWFTNLFLCLNVRVARVTDVHWAHILHRPPTASPVELGTGVLWVSTGTHPCGSPSRQDDGETRAPALRTLDDVLRLSRTCGL